MTKFMPRGFSGLTKFMPVIMTGMAMAGFASAQALPHPIVLGGSNAVHVAGTGADLKSDFNAPPPTEREMHLLTGHSIFVNTKHRISRVYITNPAVLNSYTANPNQIVVTGQANGISNLILWDEVGDSQVYAFSVESDLNDLQKALKTALPQEDITAKATEGRIVLSGTVGTQATVDSAMKIAALYSKEVSNGIAINSSKVQQVRLKVRFVEVDRSKGSQFGLNFFSGAGNTIAQTTTSQYPSSPVVTPGSSTVSVSDPLNFFVYSAKLNIGATLKDLENKNLLQILAEPTITTMNGQKANFLAGGEFPFPVVQGGSGGFTSISIQFRPYGVKLDFTPVVNTDGTIDLSISPEVSALDYTNAVSISGYTIPALSTRRADTRVVLRSGQSFAISGLLDRRTTDSFNRTPGAASIPIIGQLFRSKNISHSLSELVVIVTPEIIDPLTMHEAIAEPQMVVPDLLKSTFDKTIQKKESKFNTESPQQ